MKIPRASLLAASAVLALCASTAAQTVYGSFSLEGSQAVPPNGSANTGTAEIQLDTATNTLSWDISWAGFGATAAHFHGAAPAGSGAGVQVNIGTGNPASGSAVLSNAQETMVLDGLMYVNVHSAAFPGGELRGQVHLSWQDLGGGTIGVAGQPTVVGGGPLTGGATATIDLSNAPPAAAMLGWLSFVGAPIAAIGGTIHANPPANQFLFFANALGELNLALPWPTSIPPGTEAYVQFIVQDFTSIHGLTLSNGVKLTTP